MKMSNKVYDILKFIAQILLPALGTLYFALARIWNFPFAEEIVGTITAVDAFLGALLGISTMQYNKAKENQAEG
ncbi:MAG: phage holin [Clostridia bacterium]|nr:phage holin [Clostridia bacterium]MBO7663333.1 phage holin [Clostridia bacterium]